MQDTRFKPPEAKVRDQPLAPGSAIKGIVIGLIVDIVGTLVLSFAAGIIYAILQYNPGMTAEEIKAATVGSPWYAWISLASTLGGAAFSVMGGYVCERISRRGNYRVGIIMGFISVSIGFALSSNAITPLLRVAGLSLLTLASILLGTRLGWQRT